MTGTSDDDDAKVAYAEFKRQFSELGAAIRTDGAPDHRRMAPGKARRMMALISAMSVAALTWIHYGFGPASIVFSACWFLRILTDEVIDK